MRSLSEIPEGETARFSVDLVSGARRNLEFLRLVDDNPWLQAESTIIEAIRRYDRLWMPLLADLSAGLKPPMVLPPLDVEWVWFVHTLNPVDYMHYCESRFSKLIGKPAIFDKENEEYAFNRCRELWEGKFPTEPFENESDSNMRNSSSGFMSNMLDQVLKQRDIYRRFSEPYYCEKVYLIAAKQRYNGFMYMANRFTDENSRLVPASDVLLMWLTHQSYPTVYTADVNGLEGGLGKIIGIWETMKEEDVDQTKTLWEKIYDQPYEKAGAAVITKPMTNIPPFCWEMANADTNTRYKTLMPRFYIEVCISVKKIPNIQNMKRDLSRLFLRFRMAKCHRELKMEKQISSFTSETWQKAWHLYSEFGTKGLVLELCSQGGLLSKGSSLQESTFCWNDLLRAPSLTSEKGIDERLKVIASVTPPVQASYLLKCVPDRVTDDSGAMISDVFLKMNHYHPQEGRWLSRTVLDHAGRECFTVRMRVGKGFWRRGGEAPAAVKWGERIIEIREGSWSYVTGSTSIGIAPAKVVGTATPKEPPKGFQASWSFSTGDELLIQWDSAGSLSSLRFGLISKSSPERTLQVKLLPGRQLQYQVDKSVPEITEGQNNGKKQVYADEDEFMTIIRYSEENPNEKATALLNWKLLVVEYLPEEDTVLVLLLCLTILRSISEMKREDVGNLLVRRRIREAKIGERDWGSVLVHPSSYSPLLSSPHIHPWYWNAKLVMAYQEKDHFVGSSSTHSEVEGGDKLYKSLILP